MSVLNSRAWDKTQASGRSPCVIAAQLLTFLKTIVDSITDSCSLSKDQARSISSLPGFDDFVTRTGELHVVRLNALTNSERLSFLLNIYNMLVMHGVIVRGPPVGGVARTSFFSNCKYVVGELGAVSPIDIEHMYLRASTCLPSIVLASVFIPKISERNPRAAFWVAPEPRVSFAMCCGALSSPPLIVYHPESIEEQLEMMTKYFLEQTVRLDSNKLFLPRVLDWYRQDFLSKGSAVSERDQLVDFASHYLNPKMAKKIGDLLRADQIKVDFVPYNWSAYYYGTLNRFASPLPPSIFLGSTSSSLSQSFCTSALTVAALNGEAEATSDDEELVKRMLGTSVDYLPSLPLLTDESKSVLNSRIWRGDSLRHPCDVAADLLQFLKTIVDSITDGVSITRDQARTISSLSGFEDFCRRTSELQAVKINGLSNAERLCFFLNVYNMLVMHSVVVREPPTSTFERTAFFASSKYLIGELGVINSVELEHRYLRAASSLPSIPLSTFVIPKLSDGDPKKVLCVAAEPRVSFALCCGSRSSPPVVIYRPDSLDEDLEVAAKLALEQVRVEADKLYLPRVFEWYRSDFVHKTCPTRSDQMITFVLRYLAPESCKLLNRKSGFKVEYLPYDWHMYYYGRSRHDLDSATILQEPRDSTALSVSPPLAASDLLTIHTLPKK